MSQIPTKLVKLFDAARKAREYSYSPYSGHKVGAAIRLKSGEIFGGCNIENSSYGATNCAERVAIHKAVSEHGRIEIVEVLVITDSPTPWPPCGMCRQVLSEFASADTAIHATNLAGDLRTRTFGEMLPEAFTPAYLVKN